MEPAEYEAAYTHGARHMQAAVRNLLERYARHAEAAGDHITAQKLVYYANKVEGLPTDHRGLTVGLAEDVVETLVARIKGQKPDA